MAEPQLVGDCVVAMCHAVKIPVTVKTRIGIDNRDSYEELHYFIETVANAGCKTFIIHARKAWLNGLSPKENREIPPLRYDVVYQLKRDFPHLKIIINGGITSLEQAQIQLDHVDGVMIGRAAYQTPNLLSKIDQLFYGDQEMNMSQHEILDQYIQYIEEQLTQGVQLKHMARHILGLFNGFPSAKKWRRYLSENMHQHHVDSRIIKEAVKILGLD
jgi:tRNA-dihydrouridine synthase A